MSTRISVVVLALALTACSSDDTGDAGDAGDADSGMATSGATNPTGGATSGAVTGGASTSGGSGEPSACGAPAPADPVAPEGCENPQPGSQISADQPSGWTLCDNGMKHREEAVACVGTGDCTVDADCAEGQICECAGATATCITAYCTTDADCAAGYHCWRWNQQVACDGPFDHCRVEPCVVDGTSCENCEYVPEVCAMSCVDYGPCTG